jgi:ABC-type antimicrobial peptide transport system permease subunit
MLMWLGAIGFVLAQRLSRWMAKLFSGVRPFDPLTYGISDLVIVAALLAACYVPARRAVSLNPIEAFVPTEKL